MKVKTAVQLAGALTILVFFGVAEALSYRQAAEFFTHHEALIQQGGDSETVLAALRQRKQSLLLESSVLRMLSSLGAVAAFSLALNLLWRRLVSQPIDLLRDRMNTMSPGTWTQAIPVEQDDEIGRLVRDFNLLGPSLIFAAHQFAAASRLTAMAQIGQRVTR